MYNTKMFLFPNGTIQVRSYSNPIVTKEDKQFNIDDFATAAEYENPFTGEKLSGEVPEMFASGRHFLKKLDCAASDPEEEARKKAHSVRTATTRAKNKVMQYARSTKWEWFTTFTFDPDKVDSFSYDECKKKVSNWCSNMRKRYAPNLKYILVPELHKSGRWHFHGLFANCGSMGFSRAVNSSGLEVYGYTKKCKKIPLFIVDEWNFGFSTASRVANIRKAANYVVKYMGKQLVEATHSGQRYLCSKNLELPEVIVMMCDTFGKSAAYDILSLLDIDCTIDYEKRVNGDYLDMWSFEFGLC